MLNNIKKPVLYAIVAVAQVLLCMVGFLVFRQYPMGVIFCGYGDGLKNMFTLISYISEPVGAGGIFKYNSFCYPFGDYVYFTDNMPLFSLPFRFFCHYIYDISAYTVPVFNLFIISNIIVCGLLVFAVFHRLLKDKTWALILSITLPWTNMQLQRVIRGHYSLSFTSLVLAAFYLLILWQQYRGQRKKQIYVGIAMIGLSFLAFLAHGYLFAIITMFVACALLLYSLFTFKGKDGLFNLCCAVAYPIVSTGFTLAFAGITDGYLSLRKENAMGYDWMEQKVRFSGLFSHYSFNKVFFPFSAAVVTNDLEKAAYLSNIGLYALAAIFIAALLSGKARKIISDIQQDYFKDPLRKALLFSGLILLSVSFGEVYYTSLNYDDGYRLINITNPFFYLHQLTKKVEQFRSLERFIFPFYFAFYLWITYLLVQLFARMNTRIRVLLFGIVIFLGGAEIKDNVDRMQAATDVENPLNATNLKKMKLPAIDPKRYQAILPIPYYCAGSEDYDYTIDVPDHWFLFTQQLCLKTGLPLMSFVLSRVPPAHNIALLNCVANDAMDEGFMKLFNSKPVLVSVNKKMITDSTAASIPANANAAALYRKACQFATRNNLQPIDSVGDIVYYEWYPNRKS
ncbi:MAG: hypothetical protein K9G49_15130 [Taibaiella sp.]|nr:hypothetical protein [Taibaiella sp.]